MTRKIVLLFIVLPFILTACSKNDTNSAPLSDWNYGQITGRSIGGKEIPTTMVIECRKKSDSQVTYVFQVISNTRDAVTTGESEKVTTYPNSELHIKALLSGVPSEEASKYILDGSVELKKIEKKYFPSKFEIRALDDIEWKAREAYPLFSGMKSGVLLLRIQSEGTWRLHEGGVDFPGAPKGSFLECNPHL